MKNKKIPKMVFYGFRKTPYPVLGVGYITSNLKKNNCNWDFQYLECLDSLDKAAEVICKIKPEIVGLSATSVNFNDVKILSGKIKEAYDPAIFLGGAHISSVPQTLPPEIDIGFLGESEQTIIDVFTLFQNEKLNKKGLQKIDGIAFFDDNGELQINKRRPFFKDLDSYPKPDRGIFSKKYWETGTTSILTSRGCPYSCSFCQVTAEWKICRYNSAGYVVDEISELVDKYGIHTLGVVDDLFVANKKRIREIIKKMKEVGLLGKVHFAVSGRSNLIDDELVELLIEMGAVEIALGMESMSPKILPLLKDKVTVEDNIRAVETIYRHGIKAGGLFMIGTPTETVEDMAITYNYAKENRHKFGGMQICITTPLPNTPLWDMVVEKKIIDPDINRFPWSKLNIAAEDLDTNLYVCDVDKELFVKILHKFRQLFFPPPPPPQPNAEQSSLPLFVQKTLCQSQRIKNLMGRVFSARTFDKLMNDPMGFYNSVQTKINNLVGPLQYWVNDPNDFLYDPKIDPANVFQHGLQDCIDIIEEEGKKYYKISRIMKVRMIGLFNKLSISYKTINDSVDNPKAVEIKVGGNKFYLHSTNGKIQESTFLLRNKSQKRGVQIVHIKILEQGVELLLNKLEVDFFKIKQNYIKPGVNEFKQVKSGYYPTELWPEGKVFWTKSSGMEFFLAYSGNERKIVIEFLTGSKKAEGEAYNVQLNLFDDNANTPFLQGEIKAKQDAWSREEFQFPVLKGNRIIKGIIISDGFIPLDMGISKDPRNLGIAVKKIFLE